MNMKKLIGILVTLGTILVLVGCGNTIQGRGPLVARDFDVENFTGINIGGSFYVTWRQSDEFAVRIEMQENLFNYHTVNVQNNTLRVRRRNNTSLTVTNENRPRLYVYAPTLSSVNFSGSATAQNWDTITGENFAITISGSATVDVEVDVQAVEINISGSGRFTLAGTTDSLDIQSSGSGRIIADNLQATTASINVSGSGNVDVNVTDSLDVRVSGSGTIRYSGNPTVSQNISGSGRVVAQ
jgi:hypothetical protein